MGEDVAKINSELVKYSQSLAMAVNEYSDACRDAAEKRSTFDLERAKSLLRSSLKTVAEYGSEALVVCESSMREVRIAEALREALKERIRALESVLNACQTRASFLKAEMKLAGQNY
jgi:thioredoxin-related protein